jgi:hypothetical protein
MPCGLPVLIAHNKGRANVLDCIQGGGKRRDEATLNSFVETEHVLDGIHNGRVAVCVAI